MWLARIAPGKRPFPRDGSPFGVVRFPGSPSLSLIGEKFKMCFAGSQCKYAPSASWGATSLYPIRPSKLAQQSP